MASMVVGVLSGIDEDVLELQVSMDNLMAVHVLDAICKLLEDMPCLRHLRRCTVLAKWPNTGLEEVEVDSVHQTLLQNVAKLHPRDLHRSS